MYSHKSIVIIPLFAWVLFMSQINIAMGSMEKFDEGRLRLYVVFNNVSYKAGLETGWGFSCLIEGLDETVLFDTGGNGDILLSNML